MQLLYKSLSIAYLLFMASCIVVGDFAAAAMSFGIASTCYVIGWRSEWIS